MCTEMYKILLENFVTTFMIGSIVTRGILIISLWKWKYRYFQISRFMSPYFISKTVINMDINSSKYRKENRHLLYWNDVKNANSAFQTNLQKCCVMMHYFQLVCFVGIRLPCSTFLTWMCLYTSSWTLSGIIWTEYNTYTKRNMIPRYSVQNRGMSLYWWRKYTGYLTLWYDI